MILYLVLMAIEVIPQLPCGRQGFWFWLDHFQRAFRFFWSHSWWIYFHVSTLTLFWGELGNHVSQASRQEVMAKSWCSWCHKLCLACFFYAPCLLFSLLPVSLWKWLFRETRAEREWGRHAAKEMNLTWRSVACVHGPPALTTETSDGSSLRLVGSSLSSLGPIGPDCLQLHLINPCVYILSRPFPSCWSDLFPALSSHLCCCPVYHIWEMKDLFLRTSASWVQV